VIGPRLQEQLEPLQMKVGKVGGELMMNSRPSAGQGGDAHTTSYLVTVPRQLERIVYISYTLGSSNVATS
jgi:hypothetical protein